MNEVSRKLIADWMDGSITKEDFAVLEELLLHDPAMRKRLRQEVNLDLVLREQASVTCSLKAWSSEHGEKKKIIAFPTLLGNRWLPWAIAASVALLLSSGTFFWGGNRASKKEVAKVSMEETNLGCAILTSVVNAEWLGDAPPMRTGDTLNAGTLKLACGYAQIEFFSGATLLLEGDAELEIVSPWEAICHSGKARVRVPPPARGFQLHAPGMRLVDLGTEFGVQVNPEDLSSEVHVFEGEVVAHPENREQISLKGGHGLLKNGANTSLLSSVRPNDFMGMEKLDGINTARAEARYDAWCQWKDNARNDPRLIAFFPFHRNANWERIVNNAALPRNDDRNGGIVGARWTEGRWPMKDALEFKRPGDRVRIRLDGSYEGLTFSTWVKVDGLDRKYNALILTDGYDPGEPHWQIYEDGRLMFSIMYPDINNPNKKINQIYYSPVIFNRSNIGRWHHLAVTYDNCSGEVVQYADGKEISREISPLYQPGRQISYGACEMGNWGLPTQGQEFPVRNLNGCLDEFAIYSAALASAEIRKMYEAGKPE